MKQHCREVLDHPEAVLWRQPEQLTQVQPGTPYA